MIHINQIHILPGANTETHEPMLLNDDLSSVEVDDPTAVDFGDPAGDNVHASLAYSFPAAAATGIP